MTREVKLKSTDLPPMDIDPRKMVERLLIQAAEMKKFSWQFAENGPTPDLALQEATAGAVWLKKSIGKDLEKWEDAIGNLVGEESYTDLLFVVPYAHASDVNYGTHKTGFRQVATMVADIARSAMYVEQGHQRMMSVIDPQRKKPKPEEQAIYDQRALDRAENRKKIDQDRREARKRKDEEWRKANPDSRF